MNPQQIEKATKIVRRFNRCGSYSMQDERHFVCSLPWRECEKNHHKCGSAKVEILSLVEAFEVVEKQLGGPLL